MENEVETEDYSKKVVLKTNNYGDELIESSKYTVEHYKGILILLLYLTGDGMLMISSSLIVPIISKPWLLTQIQIGFIGATVFIGYTIGALLSGMISDNYGRKLCFIIGNLCTVVGGIMTLVFPIQYIVVSLSNIIVGFSIGIALPCVFSLLSEIFDKYSRSLIGGMGWIIFPIGEIALCIYAQRYNMWDFGNNSWKLLLFIRTFPFGITLVMSLIIIESPKFLLMKNNEISSAQAFCIITKVIGRDLTAEEKETIGYNYRISIENTSNKKNSLTLSGVSLFSEKHCFKTIVLFIDWFISSYVYYGLVYILPSIYEQLNPNGEDGGNIAPAPEQVYHEIISNVIVSCGFEFPCSILVGVLPNIKGLGRKGTIIIGFTMATIFGVICGALPEYIVIASAGGKGTICIGFNIGFIYTPEHYPTFMRVTSLGGCNFFSRFGGIVTPLINQILGKHGYTYNIVGFVAASFIALVLSMMLPGDKDEDYL